MQRKPLESILSEEDKNEKVLWEKGIKKRDQHFDKMSRAQSNEKDNHATLFYTI